MAALETIWPQERVVEVLEDAGFYPLQAPGYPGRQVAACEAARVMGLSLKQTVHLLGSYRLGGHEHPPPVLPRRPRAPDPYDTSMGELVAVGETRVGADGQARVKWRRVRG